MRLIIVLFSFLLIWIQPVSALQSLPQAPQIQAFFNQNQSSEYTDPYRNILKKGDHLEQMAIDAISNADSIALAFFEFRLPLLAQALVERHQAGATVRLIIDNQSNDLEPVNGEDALTILREAGIPIIDDTADGTSGSGLMHHKFIVIDDQTVITGSANMTPSGLHGDDEQPNSRGNANHLLKIESPEIAQVFQEEFNLMWGDGPGGKTDSLFGVNKPVREAKMFNLEEGTVTVRFSPTSKNIPFEKSTNWLIGHALAQAYKSINLALFVFSEQKIADVLEQRHDDGVEIRVLIDPGFAYRDFSEGLDLLGIERLNRFCEYEDNNNPWSNPIKRMGVPNLVEGDKLHHKYGVIDNEIVITGSHNWSAAANNENDEALLVIDNSTVAAHFVNEFNRLASDARFGVPQWVRAKIEDSAIECQIN